MNKKIMIINIDMGNVGSVAHALDYLGSEYSISNNKTDLERSDGLIFPGVGAFSSAMENLKRFDLLHTLEEQVLVKKKPFFGICLGMQLLAQDSTEGGSHKGLGWIAGHVTVLQPEGSLCVPHVGWNNVKVDHNSSFFKQIDGNSHFYFDHSYHIECDEDVVVATCEYGGACVTAIHKENIFATQFHPEKSQRNGLKVLRNFLNFVESN